MKKLLFIFLMLAVLTGCHGLRMGVGLKGEVIDEDTLVLDGDTFTIQNELMTICLSFGTMNIPMKRHHATF